MDFVPRFFNISALFIGLSLCLLSASKSHADTNILVWGDSLSAAYNIPINKGWVSLLQEELGDDVVITNGSISGETTQGGLTRISSALEKHSPNFLILELGANDGLRGIPPTVTKNNLKQIITQANKANVQVILLGMKIPPNYGPAYSKKFEELFAELAKEYQLPFIPFFLENIALDISLLQADELHPTAEAQPIILQSILPTVKKALTEK